MLKEYKYILLDLDGTVTDSMEGITKSIQYALKYFDIEVKDLNQLRKFVGPPLKESLMEFYHFSETQAEAGINKYRERFAETGIYENAVYPGIEPLLRQLNAAGKEVMLATGKPAYYAQKILDYFHLSPYFKFVGGSGLDGSLSHKDEVIQHVLENNNIQDLSQVVMVGDRKHDIKGAQKVGIDNIGVLYGYGDEEELTRAGADRIVASVEELGQILLV
ncbi:MULTISPECIES: HAD-IA family hydrolase [unclassified Butyricimonas]|uniref:HAD-IA family hydrolase n=1 Tax=unclassified Butyricimonas TaxID=2637652 RepID=UPI000C08117B|nr:MULTISPECIES: HAD-IA family hydrolase [unclassified Butyricimonas]